MAIGTDATREKEMFEWSARSLAVTIGICAASAPVSVFADSKYPAKVLLSTSETIVGEAIRYPTSGAAKVTAAIVTLAPGEMTAWHQHGVPMFAYILEGEITVDYGSKGKNVFKAGDALIEAMTVTHRGMNLGDTPVRLLAVYMGGEGAQNVMLRDEPAQPAPAQ